MIFEYRPPSKGITARCSVAIRRFGRTAARSIVVMLTELPDNPGVSVTNAYEYIATKIVQQESLSPFRIIWIEHYPPQKYCREETFDLVTLEWDEGLSGRWTASHPDWFCITRECAAALIGAENP